MERRLGDIVEPIRVRWRSEGLIVLHTGVSIPAGFPSPAADHVEDEIDLQAYIVRHELATRWTKVGGDRLVDLGIHPGDVVVIDRTAHKEMGQVVLALVDGEHTLKQLARRGHGLEVTY